ncbi:hypothetical protein EDD18DRAFT_1351431 [Armillaria luteobubalina]|uniref:Uncharacterized protein n=1 Tax=Armillaria luteobubalina TaxID=153913 RepID=A0AA39Q7F4_9AGAR|nr:hypothetical protein EDD18DRAFT_1351431 [Armillaria luteobubalina]
MTLGRRARYDSQCDAWNVNLRHEFPSAQVRLDGSSRKFLLQRCSVREDKSVSLEYVSPLDRMMCGLLETDTSYLDTDEKSNGMITTTNVTYRLVAGQ